VLSQGNCAMPRVIYDTPKYSTWMIPWSRSMLHCQPAAKANIRWIISKKNSNLYYHGAQTSQTNGRTTYHGI